MQGLKLTQVVGVRVERAWEGVGGRESQVEPGFWPTALTPRGQQLKMGHHHPKL